MKLRLPWAQQERRQTVRVKTLRLASDAHPQELSWEPSSESACVFCRKWSDEFRLIDAENNTLLSSSLSFRAPADSPGRALCDEQSGVTKRRFPAFTVPSLEGIHKISIGVELETRDREASGVESGGWDAACGEGRGLLGHTNR
eukprot:873615-Rhodomonas_salina.2